VEEWLDGTAVYYWFLNPYMGANDFLKVIITPFVTNEFTTPFITWGTLAFELSLFLGLVMAPKHRLILLRWAILFHFLIAVIHGLIPFFLAMTASLIIYLRPLDKSYGFQ